MCKLRSGVSVLVWAMMCRLLFSQADLTGPRLAVEFQGLSSRLSVPQKGSPVHLLAVSASTSLLFNGALVWNAGESNLVEIQIGVLLSGQRRSQTLVSPVIPVLVAPDSVTPVFQVLPWKTGQLIAMAKSEGFTHLTASWGVVSARFEDGFVFTHDLSPGQDFEIDPQDPRARLSFERIDLSPRATFGPAAEERANMNSKALLSGVSAAGITGTFWCGGSVDHIWCQNYGTSCTVNSCWSTSCQPYMGKCQESCCPCQTCSYRP